MEINMVDIGKRIRKRRKELNLTQTDIDQECGIKSGALSQIEHGTRTPSVITFYSLSKALDCDIEWLITGESTNLKNHEIYEKEENLLGEFRELPLEEQDEILTLLHMKYQKVQRKRMADPKSSISTGLNVG